VRKRAPSNANCTAFLVALNNSWSFASSSLLSAAFTTASAALPAALGMPPFLSLMKKFRTKYGLKRSSIAASQLGNKRITTGTHASYAS
jgi:hypothetical protein